MNPLFHWTDSKIRCQILTGMIALTILRLIELRCHGKIKTNQGSESGRAIIAELRNLHQASMIYPGRREIERVIEAPTQTQAEVLKCFGWEINSRGVLQPTFRASRSPISRFNCLVNSEA